LDYSRLEEDRTNVTAASEARSSPRTPAFPSMRDVPERPLPDPWGKNRACSSYLLDDARGYKPEIWAMMAELGWLGLLLPEEYGGGR